MRSKYLSAIALSLALTAGSALAADLPSRKAPAYLPPPPPPPLWTGFYVGLNAGGTFGGSESVTLSTLAGPIDPNFANIPAVLAGQTAAAASANGVLSANRSGFIGGGQIGYNWQFNNSFVVGIEADIQGIAGASGSASGFGAAPIAQQNGFSVASLMSVTNHLDYLGTVRGRLGFLVTPTLLAYGTGGLAYGGVSTNVGISSSFIPTDPFFGAGSVISTTGGSFSDTRVGWTAGGGLEWMFLPNWSAKVEYLYYDLGSYSFSAGTQANFVPGTGVVFTNFSQATTSRFDGHIVRAGVNYHFNWGAPAPVVAKY